MAEWYRKIDFIISPSDHESFHYAVADGMVSGCIPLIWPWEQAKDIYGDEYVFASIPTMLACIRESLEWGEEELKHRQEKNVETIVKRYGYSAVFEGMNKLLDISVERC